jgi:hypothetical protein
MINKLEKGVMQDIYYDFMIWSLIYFTYVTSFMPIIINGNYNDNR